MKDVLSIDVTPIMLMKRQAYVNELRTDFDSGLRFKFDHNTSLNKLLTLAV